MKADLASIKSVLANAPASALEAKLFRRVPFLALVNSSRPDWLYTSGRPQRYNPAGVHCVYFAEDANVSRAEYDYTWKGLSGAHQPATDYCADVKLQRVLDLTSAATLKAINVDAKVLFRNWRRAKCPTLTQLIGQAVSETKLFSAIRYPSKAAAAAATASGQFGVNLAIFRDCIQAPESVRILGPSAKPLQEWP